MTVGLRAPAGIREAPISEDSFGLTAKVLLLALLCHALAILIIGLANPLIDLHSFRQTQTALTAYWLVHGGPWLAYDTPVLGAPWSVPFEFPTFQSIAALVSYAGMPMDAAGRLVSFAFFVATLWPLRMLCRTLGLDAAVFRLSAVLLLSSPLYLYWSRTFLIESCAVFFCMLWLALLARTLERPRPETAIAAVAAGCLGVLTKATTYPAFAFLGGCLLLARLVGSWPAQGTRRMPAVVLAWAATMAAVPLAVGWGWVVFSDALKERNPLGRHLTSGALESWNFGTLGQRFSGTLWLHRVPERILPDILGYGALLGLVSLAACATSRRDTAVAGALVMAFLLPVLVFTNLHMVHDYYQYANALFLLLAVALSLTRLAELGWRRTSSAILILIVIGQTAYFYQDFFGFVVGPKTDSLLEVARLAERHTKPANALLIVGDDWSSLVPYYSGRRSIALPGWAPADYVEKLLRDPSLFLGGAPLGGIVFCRDRLHDYGAQAPSIEAFMAGREQIGEAGGCALLAPARRDP